MRKFDLANERRNAIAEVIGLVIGGIGLTITYMQGDHDVGLVFSLVFLAACGWGRIRLHREIVALREKIDCGTA